MSRSGKLELENVVNTQPIKHFVLVSKHIPSGFFPFETGINDADPWAPLSDWDYRTYEVPNTGSLEGVETDRDDMFVVEACGPSFEQLDNDLVSYGPIARMHFYGLGIRLVCANGSYVDLATSRFDFGGGFFVYEPERFGLPSVKVWHVGETGFDDISWKRDLTEAVLSD